MSIDKEIKVNKEELLEFLSNIKQVLSEHVNDEDMEEGTREAIAFQQANDWYATVEAQDE